MQSWGLLILWCCAPLIAAPTTKTTNSAALAAKAINQTDKPKLAASALAASPIPVALFEIQGKDPFFPNRRPTPELKPGPNKPLLAPVALFLNGLSGTKSQPLAIINNYTITKGEEADIRVGNGKVHVRCVDIKEDSVIVEVNGQRQELRLRGAGSFPYQVPDPLPATQNTGQEMLSSRMELASASPTGTLSDTLSRQPLATFRPQVAFKL